jgi:DNA (cytosine-5)-methyltransferase 1
MTDKRVTCVELFAGGGLQSIGLLAAGVRIVKAYELESELVRCYKHNLGDHAIVCDINLLKPEDIPNIDLFVASPPCQSFSTGGKQLGFEDPKGDLFKKTVDLINSKQPKVFWIENVKGLISEKFINIFSTTISVLEQNYVIQTKVINSWDWGAPQKRERVFIVGVRKDLGATFVFPKPDSALYRTAKLADVLDSIVFIPAILHQNENTIKKHPIVSSDKPLNTLTCKLSSRRVAIHGKIRSLTPRECLRVQTVPDWYEFPPGFSITNQYKVSGNGVTCSVAQAIATEIIKLLA